jgi:hypothetical protein
MLLLLTWSCVAVSFAKTFIRKAVLFPDAETVADAGGLVWHAVNVLRAQLVVQAIFTAGALVVTWAVLARAEDARSGAS